MCIIRAEQVSYSYQTKYQTIQAVKGVTQDFETGTLYAITGESGSGKSTFLSLLAGLALPQEGRIMVDGKDLSEMDRDRYRRQYTSVVYQSFHLFPLLNAVENVMFPLELRKINRQDAEKRAKEYIDKVGLTEKNYRQFPQMMSGGEQQRVAIARAMASGGRILLADEPTGNLDTENEQNIVGLLQRLAHERDYTVIVITHNPAVAGQADVVLTMLDGCLVKREERGSV